MEHNDWFKKAERDFQAAKDSLNAKNYEWSCFQSQQAVEKALKSLLIKRFGDFPRIHDLVRLGKDVKLPSELSEGLKELTLSYIYTRYPDIEGEPDLKEKSLNFLNITDNILKWVKKNL